MSLMHDALLVQFRKSLAKYEKDLLCEYNRRQRPADGLSAPQLNMIVTAADSGQDSFNVQLDEDEGKWYLTNGEEEQALEGFSKEDVVVLGIEPSTCRCMVQKKPKPGTRVKKSEIVYADTLLPPIISDEDEINRQYLKARPYYLNLLPPEYDEAMLDEKAVDDEGERDDEEDDEDISGNLAQLGGKNIAELVQLLQGGKRKDPAEKTCLCGLPNKTCGVCGMGYGQRVSGGDGKRRKALPMPETQVVPPSDSEDDSQDNMPKDVTLNEPWTRHWNRLSGEIFQMPSFPV